MIMTKKFKKNQIKSRWYYVFWGIATISVVAGQMYVGTGYRQMSKAFNRIIDTFVVISEREGDVIRY